MHYFASLLHQPSMICQWYTARTIPLGSSKIKVLTPFTYSSKCQSILIPFAGSTDWNLVTKEWAGTFLRVIKKKRTVQMRGDIHFFAFLQVKIHKGRGSQMVSRNPPCEVWKGLRPNKIPDHWFQDGVLFLLQWKIATATGTARGKQSKDHPAWKMKHVNKS